MTEAIIKVEGLSGGYGKRTVLQDVTFEVPRGSIYMIIGGSGSGKTTLLRLLIGLLPTRAGSIDIGGEGPADLVNGPPRFGVTFQEGALFGSMSLLDNVMLPLQKWTDLSDDAIAAIARSRLRLVGLEGFEDYPPADLSGGMKKRAGVARALALEPELLFLDEPSAGLDPVRSAEFDELMRSLNETLGVTIVLVTHELQSILGIGQECILLDESEHGVVARGKPRELLERDDDPRVHAFFHREPRKH